MIGYGVDYVTTMPWPNPGKETTSLEQKLEALRRHAERGPSRDQTGGSPMTSAAETKTYSGVTLHPEAEKTYRERTRGSLERWEKMRELVPTGHTGGMWYQLPYPTLMERAKGSRIWDVDGNEYFDFRIGDWVLIHGHCNDTIRDAIVAQLDQAVQFGAPDWDLGYRMASALVDRMPSFEKIRFSVSGTDCNQLALRLARTYTGRQKIAKMNAGLPRRR